MFFVTLLLVSVTARIRQTDRLPLDVEEWINQANQEEKVVPDSKSSKLMMGEEQSGTLPSDVKNWVRQINEEKETEWPSKVDVQNEEQTLPDDVAAWIEQINRDRGNVGSHSKLDRNVQDRVQNGEFPSDCSVVVTLWKKMGGKTKLDPKTVYPTDCCMTSKKSDFDHVRCEGDRVIQIDWRYSQLQGSLPEEIGMLQNLKQLYLSDNELTGSIPAAIGNCRSLVYLDMSHNKLSGSIPPEMGKLTNLGWLFLWNNNLQGNIPNELGQLDRLVSLYVFLNNISGVGGNPNLNDKDLPGPLRERKDVWKLWLW